MTQPLLKQGRIWTACLWAATVATGLGALHSAWDFGSRRAMDQSALLVPATTWNESQRDRARADIQAHPEVRQAAWISPSELARETGELLPPERWPEILSQEDAWLPWILEIRWRDPILQFAAIQSRSEALRLDAQWKIVLWDDEELMRERSGLLAVMSIGGAGLSLVFIMGTIALATGPRRERGALAEGFAVLFVSAVAIGTIGGLAMLEGFYPDPKSWGVAGVAAFLLAGVVTPMIKRPKFGSGTDAPISAPVPVEQATAVTETPEFPESAEISKSAEPTSSDEEPPPCA